MRLLCAEAQTAPGKAGGRVIVGYERAHVGRQDLGSIGTELALVFEHAQALPFGAVVAGNV